MGYLLRQPPSLTTVEGVRSWVEDELTSLSQVENERTDVTLNPIYVAPKKPTEGMIVYADGVRFNPTGEGPGAYEYSGGAWRKLFHAPITYNVFTRTVNGLVPFPGGAGTTRFLREDSTWAVPPFPVQATTTQTGIMETATDTEALAEVSTVVAVTPSNLGPVFTSNFAAFSGRGRFLVYRGGLQGGMVASNFNVIAYDTVVLDAQSWWHNATSLYLPLEAGWYWFWVSVAIAPLATAETAQALIYKNSVAVARGFYATNVGSWLGPMTVGALVQMNGTSDFVNGEVFLPAGVGSIPGGATDTFITGWKVSS